MRVVFLFSILNVVGIQQEGSTTVAVPVNTVLVYVLWDLLSFKVGRWSNRKQAACLLCLPSGDTSPSSKIMRRSVHRCAGNPQVSGEGWVAIILLAKITKSSCVKLINLIYLWVSTTGKMHWRPLTWFCYEVRKKRTQQFPVPSKTSGPHSKLSDGAIIATVILKYFILWGLFGSFNCLAMIAPILNTALIQSFLRKNLIGIVWASRPQLGSVQEAL